MASVRSVTIREMQHADIDAVLLLCDAVAEERLWIGTEPGYDRERVRTIFARAIDGQQGLFVARAADGSLAGVVSTYPHEAYGWTLGMMVQKRMRGRGIGRALLDTVIGWARDRTIAHLSLLVFPHNERALALYRSAGFEEIERYAGDVTRADGSVWDTILMRKQL